MTYFTRCVYPNHNDPQCLDLVRARQIDLLLNGGTPRRVGPELLRAAPRGVLNAHHGILPNYRGATCCEWAIHNDEPVGVTAHFMDEGLDSGPILFPSELRIRKGMDYAAVRVALYRLALKTADVLNLLKTRPELAILNAHVEQKKFAQQD